ncbi:hypothetical protein LPJ56_003712, partial [Coemansia sp. RSA 2599]
MDSTIKVFDMRRIIDKADAASMGTWDQGSRRSTILRTGDSCIRTFAAHTASVKRAAVMPDQPFEFLSCSEDGTARHFDIREPAPLSSVTHRASLRGGRVIANYSSMHAELHALDANPFHSSIFAVGGSVSSIMVHDRRMTYPNRPTNEEGLRGIRNWTGDRCIVRLRTDTQFDGDEVYERTSENIVTGLRFSRDVANQIIGSWCYNHVYLFDLNESRSYLNAICVSPRDSAKRSRSRRGSVDSYRLPEAKRTCTCGGSTAYSAGAEGADFVGPRYPASMSHSTSVHGCVCSAHSEQTREFQIGLREKSRNISPRSHGSSTPLHGSACRESSARGPANVQLPRDVGMGPELCDICQIEKHILEDALSELVQPRQTLSSIYEMALPATEREFVYAAFNAFVSSMAIGALPRAKDAVSFAIRQLEHEGIEPLEQSLRKTACSLGDGLYGDTGTRLEEMLSCLSTDPGLERRRIRSLLHNNRACISATSFRQKWVRLFEGYLKDTQPCSMTPHSVEYLLGEIHVIRNDLSAAIRDCNISVEYNRFNMLACFNLILLVWDSARIDCTLLILQLRNMLASGDSDSVGGPQAMANGGRSSSHMDQLRAEFGELTHRLGDLGAELNSGLKEVREMDCEINGFRALADGICRREASSHRAMARLYHQCE